MRALILILLMVMASQASSELMFSEVLYDAETPEARNEWIEIQNTAPEHISLSGLIIEDNSGSYTIPADTTIAANGFFVMARDAGYFNQSYGMMPDLDGFTLGLNNGGDKLELKEEDQAIDYVEWGTYDLSWGLTAPEGESLQRNPQGVDTDTPNDWLVGDPSPGKAYAPDNTSTTTTTQSSSTTLPQPTTTQPDSSTTTQPSSSTESTTTTLLVSTTLAPTTTSSTTTSTLKDAPNLIFTEVCYDTPGNDNVEEWLEIHNMGQDSIDLEGLVVADGKASYTLPSYILQPEDTVVIARDFDGFTATYGASAGIFDLSLTLNNNGDKLTISQAEQVIDEMAWEDYLPGWGLKARTGECLQRDPDGEWTVSDEPTPGDTRVYYTTTTSTTQKKRTTTTRKTTTTSTLKPTTTTRKTTSTTQQAKKVTYRFTNPIKDACQNGQADQGEEGMDCGGPCSPCPTTTSTTLQQHTTTTSSKQQQNKANKTKTNTQAPPAGHAITAAAGGVTITGIIIALAVAGVVYWRFDRR
ncbi:lamin tail domain-containing protein [Candidatus Altiarchaeota archaeon]